MELFGKRLSELREKSGLTQKELSSRLGMARTTFSGYENGTREPDHQTLQKFADYFDVSIDYLLGRTDDKKAILDDQSRSLIDMLELELSDEEIINKMNFKVDGILLEPEDVKVFLALVRAERLRKKLGLVSEQNKS